MHTYTGSGLADEYDNPAMADLDLPADTPVEMVGRDEDRDLVLIEWVDAQGNPRITSVEPAVFANDFVKGTDAN